MLYTNLEMNEYANEAKRGEFERLFWLNAR